MVRTWLARLSRVRITAVYAVILICVTTMLLGIDPMAQDKVIQHASTNLHNLSHGRLTTLFDSAFVVDAGPIYEWLPGLVCLLALAELVWRSGRLVIAFTVGHVGATLLVAAWLATAVELSWLPREVGLEADVGMSYGAVAVLGTFTAAIPRPWRPMWAGWWLAVAVAAVTVGDDFTYTGHAVALVLGMLVATRFGAPRGWTRPSVILLFVASAFGYLMLTNEVPSPFVVAGAGVVGALFGAIVALIQSVTSNRRRRSARGHAPECDLAASGASPDDPSAEFVCRCLDPIGPP
jgi:hypothetical protein